ncbi:MAG: hypothetical protein GVY13_02915 [Alphaproteobacteria bacterium]|jgi:hypothetical protein|nr:hypothetical protein [Alphaproteobacteria bacterium]
MSTHTARCLLTLYAGHGVARGLGRMARTGPGDAMPPALWPFRILACLSRILGR